MWVAAQPSTSVPARISWTLAANRPATRGPRQRECRPLPFPCRHPAWALRRSSHGRLPLGRDVLRPAHCSSGPGRPSQSLAAMPLPRRGLRLPQRVPHGSGTDTRSHTGSARPAGATAQSGCAQNPGTHPAGWSAPRRSVNRPGSSASCIRRNDG